MVIVLVVVVKLSFLRRHMNQWIDGQPALSVSQSVIAIPSSDCHSPSPSLPPFGAVSVAVHPSVDIYSMEWMQHSRRRHKWTLD